MTTRLAGVLTQADLCIAELCSARLDGEVFTVGDFWCPIDEIDGAENRARALALLSASSALVVERSSAAWVYGDAPEPAVHEFCLNGQTRSRAPSSARFRLRFGRYAAKYTQVLAGLAVTLPLTTAVALAQFSEQPPETLLPVLGRLLRRAGPDALTLALQECPRDVGPTTVLARRRLFEAAAHPVQGVRAASPARAAGTDQPSLTRYTS